MGSIKYKVQSKKNPINQEVKFYAVSDKQEQVTEEEMIEQIEQKTTVSRADIRAVLSALQVEIRFNLVNGRKVKLNDIGCFRTSVSGQGANTEPEFNPSLITRNRIVFTPNPVLMKAVKPGARGVTFQRTGGEAPAPAGPSTEALP